MGNTTAEAALESPQQERSRQLRRYSRARPGLFAAGFATYGLLYCTQPLLPAFSESFGVTPAESALTLSLATQSMAFCMLIAGALSESWGRRWMMIGSMGIASIVTLLAALLPGWHTLLALRAVTGMALAGVPPVIVAYMTEEFAALATALASALATKTRTAAPASASLRSLSAACALRRVNSSLAPFRSASHSSLLPSAALEAAPLRLVGLLEGS